MNVPSKIFFTKGVGKHKDYLSSFEASLRNAGIEKCNLVNVSSIYPPKCKRISKEEGLKIIQAGQITFAVMARNSTNEPNRLIASSIGAAIPSDKSNYGYLSEYHPFGVKEKLAGDYAEDLAAQMLATTLGVEFNTEADWNEREEVFKMSDKIVKTFNITQTAEGDRTGLWTTVIAAAILLP
ncbi:MAG: arginine decarboxylase, pyruvoyl-dependent [Ignavibacteriaceae bacterium]